MRVSFSYLWATTVLLAMAGGGFAQEQIADHSEETAEPLSFELIGNPVEEKAEAARSINSLMLFDSRLYIGHGHYGHNTGPTDVIYYDFDTKSFVTEFTIDDHSIEHYNILDGKLAIAGSDATEALQLGNIYIRGEDGWVKHRSLPRAVHVMDVAEWRGVWFAATGQFIPVGEDAQIIPGGILASTDKGEQWQIDFTTPSFYNGVMRTHRLINFKNKLYAFIYAYASVPLNLVGEEHVSGTERERMGKAEMLYLSDPVGPTDAWVRGKQRWEPRDLIDMPHVSYVEPYVFKDQLVLDVKAGPYYPLVPRINYRREDPPQRLQHFLMVSDGETSRRLPLEVQVILDVLPKEDRLLMLVIKDRQFHMAETTDLAHWTLYPIPFSEGIPKQIEFDGEWLYAGFSTGKIMRARLTERATPATPPSDANPAQTEADG